MIIVTNKQRRHLASRISGLSKTEHGEIFKMLRSSVKSSIQDDENDKIPYTRNANGVFFNLNDVPIDLFKQLEDFVSFCIENNQELDAYDQKIRECKMFSHMHDHPVLSKTDKDDNLSIHAHNNTGSKSLRQQLSQQQCEHQTLSTAAATSLAASLKHSERIQKFVDKLSRGVIGDHNYQYDIEDEGKAETDTKKGKKRSNVTAKKSKKASSADEQGVKASKTSTISSQTAFVNAKKRYAKKCISSYMTRRALSRRVIFLAGDTSRPI